jgi:arylsulfatase A-like enzyme
LFRNPEMAVMSWQWRLLAMLFAVYASAGLFFGAFCGAILELTRLKEVPGSHRSAGALTLILAFAANLVRATPLAGSEKLALIVATVLAGGLLASLGIERWKKFQAFRSPFAVSLLLLGSPWLSREALPAELSSTVKIGLSILLIAALAGAFQIVHYFRHGRAPNVLGYAATAIVLCAGFLAAAGIRSRPSTVAASGPSSTPAVGKPNVVLVTMDTVRADHTSLYGYERDTTPHLREFASTATLYSRATATSDYTLPTHASLFSGLYPDWQGVVWSSALPPSVTTLADVLRSHGYWTAECVANYGFLGPSSGLTKGFDFSDWSRPVTLSTEDSPLSGRRRPESQPYYLREAAIRVLSHMTNADYFVRATRSAADIDQCAATVLDQAAGASHPFFLFVNYMDAHASYISDPPFEMLFPGRDPRLSPWSFRRLQGEVNAGKRVLQPWEKAHIVSQYDGGIAEEDSALDDLFNKLRAIGSFDNTLIVVTSDHGELFGERGLLGHIQSRVDQPLIAVPLVIKYPDQYDTKRSDLVVSQVDIMPTVLDVAGIAPPSPLEGRSLLSPASPTSRPVFAEATEKVTRRAILFGSMKLIVSAKDRPELYDLTSDPGEEHNLYAANDPRAVELAEQLDRWVAARPRQKTQPQRLDPASVERLKSLGYVQ